MADYSLKLEDRTAILIGDCDGLQRSLAQVLTQLGTDVALLSHDDSKAQRLVEQINDQREVNEKLGRAVSFHYDPKQVRTSHPKFYIDLISKVAESFGGVDILIDHQNFLQASPFKDAPVVDQLDYLYDVNLKSSLCFTQAALKFLESRKRGRIIYVMSDLIRLGVPQASVLAATRSGITQFAKSLAHEVWPQGISVNCVMTGVTEDFLLAYEPKSKSIQAAQDHLSKKLPDSQIMEYERISNLVAFLASPMSTGITGQSIATNQGLAAF